MPKTTLTPTDFNRETLSKELLGSYLVFEGIDGSGKSSLVKSLQNFFADQVVTFREPGSTKIGEEIRNLLLHRKDYELLPYTELLLFTASRSESIAKEVFPILQSGNKILIQDRSYLSTYAYQVKLNQLMELPQFFAYLEPIFRQQSSRANPLTVDFYLKLDCNQAFQRLAGVEGELDRIEAKGINYFEQVKAGYDDIFAYLSQDHSELKPNFTKLANFVNNPIALEQFIAQSGLKVFPAQSELHQQHFVVYLAAEKDQQSVFVQALTALAMILSAVA